MLYKYIHFGCFVFLSGPGTSLKAVKPGTGQGAPTPGVRYGVIYGLVAHVLSDSVTMI